MPDYTLYLMSGPLRFGASEDDAKRLAAELQAHNDEVVRLRAEVEALRADNSRQRIELENMGDTNTSLRSEVALYRGEAEKLRDLLNYVPLPPVAITYERGWKLINMFQAAAIAAARTAQGDK